MEVRRVGVIGGGLMGSGIAEVCARHGLSVRLIEASDELARAARARVEGSMARGLERGKLKEADRDAARALIACGSDIAALGDVDLVIEAIPEQLTLKREMFARIDAVAPEGAVLASNTSSIPIIDIARATGRPEQVVGTHFFNPAPVMRLLELVRSVVTSAATLERVRDFGQGVGKEVIVAQDRAGFIVNLLLIPFLNSAIRLHEAGLATRDDIDTGMRLGCNHPMGPLELLDHIGLDTHMAVCEALYAEYAEPGYAPPPLLRRMVAAGFLGRKSGRGFYDHTQGGGSRGASDGA